MLIVVIGVICWVVWRSSNTWSTVLATAVVYGLFSALYWVRPIGSDQVSLPGAVHGFVDGFLIGGAIAVVAAGIKAIGARGQAKRDAEGEAPIEREGKE